LPAIQRLGVPQENFVQISAANYNEVSWDNEQYGGLATHSLGQCLLGEARDLNNSGAITLEEVRQCAQSKLDSLMAPHKSAGMLPSSIQVRGTRNLIVVHEPPKPVAVAVVASPPPVVVAPPPAAPVITAAPVVAPAPPAKPLEQVQVAKPPILEAAPQAAEIVKPQEPPRETAVEQLTASAATLEDIYAQRNGRLKLEVSAPKSLVIGKDAFNFSVRSSTDGYLYAVMLGSDGQSFYLLYPNKLDQDNRIKANVRYSLPRSGWSIKAGGPEGTNHILFVVSQSARDPRIFAADEASGGGPFTFSVAEVTARRRLVDFFVGRGVVGRNGQMAAALLQVNEVK
jgi:hypothetical protein